MELVDGYERVPALCPALVRRGVESWHSWHGAGAEADSTRREDRSDVIEFYVVDLSVACMSKM